MQHSFTETLKEHAEEIKDKLILMYPQYKDIIEFHANAEKPFNEWFAFLFNGTNWVLKGPIKVPMNTVIIPQKKYESIGKENETPEYLGLADKINEPFFNFITVVQPDNIYGIADGWHRFHILKESGATEFTAYEWVKESNDNLIAIEIRDILINNPKRI